MQWNPVNPVTDRPQKSGCVISALVSGASSLRVQALAEDIVHFKLSRCMGK